MLSNILELFNMYTHSSVENDIVKLNNEYNERKEINQVLKKVDYKGHSNFIINFLERNKNNIDSQVLELKELSHKIKNIIKENDELLELEAECDKLVESDKVKELVEQLKLLDIIKMDINFFLSDRKTVVP